MADRVDLVNGVLPPGVPTAARTLVLALGLGMIWLSRGLARRKRRAWWLAVAGRRRLRGRAPREGPRLRGGDRAPRPAGRAPARPPAVRRARRPGDDPAARRRSAAALRRLPAAPDRLRVRPRRVLGAHRGGAADADRRASRSGRSGSGCGRSPWRPPRSATARPRGGARPAARPRQPGVLRAAPRQELLLLRQRPLVPRLSRRRRNGARRRRPDRQPATSAPS